VVVEPNFGVRKARERDPGKLQAGLCIELGPSVTRALDHQHEEAVGAERLQRTLGQCQVAEVRRIERAAEDRRPQSVTV
jgi:hypothetical protein